MIPKTIKLKNKTLPETPGVYLMKGAKGKLLYVGKAGNLRRRVESYFSRPHDYRIQKLVSEIRAIDYRNTDTAIEALILESALIKRYQPPFNVREKDDTSFLYIEITDRDEHGKKIPFPFVSAVRGKDASRGKRFGPFTASSQAREALKIIRRIFPFSTHKAISDTRYAKEARPCFDYQIGLCPGTCAGVISRSEYQKNIRNIILFLQGKKERIAKQLEQEMKMAGRKLQFEEAERLKRQLFALRHIQDVALLHEPITNDLQLTTTFRIEGYDISNISGDSAVGSMVVFINGKPDKHEYRKFRIKTVRGANDVAMMREVILRRFRNSWQLPNLILVDGGLPQARAVARAIRESGRRIPVVGLAKGPERKRNDIIGAIPKETDLRTLIRVRDEAHRFAITYHKKLRGAKFLS
jgi:excinuclease ABC subunit C